MLIFFKLIENNAKNDSCLLRVVKNKISHLNHFKEYSCVNYMQFVQQISRTFSSPKTETLYSWTSTSIDSTNCGSKNIQRKKLHC